MAMRRQATVRRFEGRVGQLCDDIAGYLNYFEQSSVFTGPSVYFHTKTIERRRSHSSAAAALRDSALFDYLYATLASWGMHRMGPKGAKLLSLPCIVSSFIQAQHLLSHYWNAKLVSLESGNVADTGDHLWDLLSSLKVSATRTKLVASSKALHHLLPDLVPPIDRQYTLRFFFGSKVSKITPPITGDGRGQFLEIFHGYHQIAKRSEKLLSASLCKDGFHGSVPKVIDNAIVGYVRKELPGEEPSP